MTLRRLEILATGPLSSVQDLGRPGHASWGVPASGAADRGALRLANRLVGNAENAAALEVTLGGLSVRFDHDVVVALTGARAGASVDGAAIAYNVATRVAAGATLTLTVPPTGLRTYLAVRGGIAVDEVLASRSTDMLSGLGPPVLEVGASLPIGDADGEVPAVEVAPRADPPSGCAVLRVHLGPRDDWFTEAALRVLTETAWTVTPESNRVGLRLDGPALERGGEDELPTEGMAPGALQVPPSGRPVLFLADGPVTGGYPVIAAVLDADLDAAGQLRPGQQVRFEVAGGRTVT